MPKRWDPLRRWEEPGEKALARTALEEGLESTRAELARAYAGFNFADDGELVESYIYEIRALQSRYSYLLRQRKALEAPAVRPAAAPDALPVG